MLAKKHRLNLSSSNNSEVFNFQSSKRFLTNCLIFYFQQNQLGTLRVAAIAPKRLFNKASQRNLHRRLIYNLLREKIKQISETQNVNIFNKDLDLVIVYKHQKITKEQIKEDLNLFFLAYDRKHKSLKKNNENL